MGAQCRKVVTMSNSRVVGRAKSKSIIPYGPPPAAGAPETKPEAEKEPETEPEAEKEPETAEADEDAQTEADEDTAWAQKPHCLASNHNAR